MNSKFSKIILICLFSIIFVSVFAQVQPSTTAAQKINVGQLYKDGEPFSHFILFVGIIVLVLFIVKFINLFIKEKLDSKKFYLKLKGYIRNEQYDEAIKVCSNFKSTSIGWIFWSGFLAFNDARKAGRKGKDLTYILQDAFDEAGLQLIPRIESGLYWFDTFAQVATLLGLLGTIWGLIKAFNALATVDDAMKQAYLTRGIYQAMSTTGFGLLVAIPTMFMRGILQGRSEKLINDIDEYSVKVMNQIHYTLKD